MDRYKKIDKPLFSINKYKTSINESSFLKFGKKKLTLLN